MFKYTILASLCLLAFAACSPTAAPTPIIIVVTATPLANPTGQATPLPPTVAAAVSATPDALQPTDAAETPSASETPDPNLKPTTVKYVMAKQDINIRNGPGTTFEIVGGVYAGQTAQVTGYKSADDAWWRVVCPVETVKNCWVSADAALTEPADTPNVGPTSTTTTEVDVESFTRQLATALQAKDFDTLKTLMGDPLTIAGWRSEGTEMPRAQAILFLQSGWLGASNEIVVDLAGKTDQTKLLDGTPPLSMWDPKVKAVKSLYVEGLNTDGKGAAILVIAQNAQGKLYLYAVLYAAQGFV